VRQIRDAYKGSSINNVTALGWSKNQNSIKIFEPKNILMGLVESKMI
jgi:hypothetical protein